MGLDMFLYRVHNVRNWSGANENSPNKKQYAVGVELNYKPVPFIGSIGEIHTITEEVMCWRKANAIHKWFVDNVQDGEDDCRSAYVSLDKIQELRTLCLSVLLDRERAPELLPCVQGFFFGGTEYDEYYFEDLENTAKVIEKIVNDAIKAKQQKHSMYLEYRSSW